MNSLSYSKRVLSSFENLNNKIEAVHAKEMAPSIQSCFKEYFNSRNLSEESLVSYTGYLKEFFGWCKESNTNVFCVRDEGVFYAYKIFLFSKREKITYKVNAVQRIAKEVIESFLKKEAPGKADVFTGADLIAADTLCWLSESPA